MAEFLSKIYFYEIITFLAGLGACMLGMRLMSDNMEKLADSRMRALFDKVSNNRWLGVGIGTAVTALVQSSTATTVMIVGFVNAGVMTLGQSIPLILGADIGTTITAHIASLQSFQITKVATILIFLGVFLTYFIKDDRKKTCLMLLAGLGLLFLGLGTMSDSMSALKDSPFMMQVISSQSNPFLLLLAGMVITAVVQSSSVFTSILVTMVTGGIVFGTGGNEVLYLILGSEVGSCAPTLLAMAGAKTDAKRAAVMRIVMAAVGTVVVMVVLLVCPAFMENTFAKWFAAAPAMQVAMFHTAFNVVKAVCLLPFTNFIVHVSRKLIRGKEEVRRVSYLDERFLKNPSIAVQQLIREITAMLRMTQAGVEKAVAGFLAKDEKPSQEVLALKEEVESITEGVTSYMVQVAARDMSYQDELTVASLYHVISDIERISDLSYNITRYTRQAVTENLTFSEYVHKDVAEMMKKLSILFRDTAFTFLHRSTDMLAEIERREDEIDAMKKRLITEHIRRLNEGGCSPESSSVFINLVGNLERAGDHLTYIARSILTEEDVK